MRKIILASASPRRKELLKLLELEFDVSPSDIDEDKVKGSTPKETVEKLSFKKASKVAEKFSDAIIIGADTIVVLEDLILGKPRDERDAEKILNSLSGKKHAVITAFTILDSRTGKKVTRSHMSNVYMRNLGSDEIKEYIASGEPMDKAGAYAIQGRAGLFVERIEGNYHSIVGLPLNLLKEELKQFNI